MEKVEVKVTWRLVWALWWRMMLISIGAWAIFYLILFVLLGMAFLNL